MVPHYKMGHVKIRSRSLTTRENTVPWYRPEVDYILCYSPAGTILCTSIMHINCVGMYILQVDCLLDYGYAPRPGRTLYLELRICIFSTPYERRLKVN